MQTNKVFFNSDDQSEYYDAIANGNITNNQLSPIPKRLADHAAVRRQYCNRDQQRRPQQRQFQQRQSQQQQFQQQQPQQQSQQQQPQQQQFQQRQPQQQFQQRQLQQQQSQQSLYQQAQFQQNQQNQQKGQQGQQTHPPVRHIEVAVEMNDGNNVRINRKTTKNLSCQEGKNKETKICDKIPFNTIKNNGICSGKIKTYITYNSNNEYDVTFSKSCMWISLAQALTIAEGFIVSPCSLRQMYGFPNESVDFIVFDSGTSNISDSVGINHISYLRRVCDEKNIKIDIYMANCGKTEGSFWIGKPAISVSPLLVADKDIDDNHRFSIVNFPGYHYELIVSKTATTKHHQIPVHYIRKCGWEIKSYKMYPEKPKCDRNDKNRTITIPSGQMRNHSIPQYSFPSISEDSEHEIQSLHVHHPSQCEFNQISTRDEDEREWKINHEDVKLIISPRVIPSRVPQNIHEQIERIKDATSSLDEEITFVRNNIEKLSEKYSHVEKNDFTGSFINLDQDVNAIDPIDEIFLWRLKQQLKLLLEQHEKFYQLEEALKFQASEL